MDEPTASGRTDEQIGKAVLVFNTGSSSLKYELFDSDERTLVRGIVTRIGGDGGAHELVRAQAEAYAFPAACPDHGTAVGEAIAGLARVLGQDWKKLVGAVGHRFVHGGPSFWRPTLLDDDLVDTLAQLAHFAPLHNGPNTIAIRAARALLPGVPQVAVFDTGFHHDLPQHARIYALPLELSERWSLRRYGFHGISCQYLVRRVTELGIEPSRRLVLCHLGAGASVTAVLDGRSVDTSMGFTPLEGLVMATRSGDLDPSLVFYLHRHTGLEMNALQRLLERESGLRGLSGLTGDYVQLEEAERGGNQRARLALTVFAYRVRKYLGAYTAALGGIDVLVFTGGIGENSASARSSILDPLVDLGWCYDSSLNAAGPAERQISPVGSLPSVWIIPTRETLTIAREAKALVGL